jgi:hypothetical protein
MKTRRHQNCHDATKHNSVKDKEHAAETLATKLTYHEKQKCSVIAISKRSITNGKIPGKTFKNKSSV